MSLKQKNLSFFIFFIFHLVVIYLTDLFFSVLSLVEVSRWLLWRCRIYWYYYIFTAIFNLIRPRPENLDYMLYFLYSRRLIVNWLKKIIIIIIFGIVETINLSFSIIQARPPRVKSTKKQAYAQVTSRNILNSCNHISSSINYLCLVSDFNYRREIILADVVIQMLNAM